MKESLAIPVGVRREVLDRDNGVCVVCGRSEGLVLHHIRYGGSERGMGGRRLHSVENVVTLGGVFDHDCHGVVHGRKKLWVPVLEAVRGKPFTGFQVLRWVASGADPVSLGLPEGFVGVG